MKKHQRVPRKVCWPVLPILDAFVLSDLIHSYSYSAVEDKQMSMKAAEAIWGDVELWVRSAEREVLRHFTAFAVDFGKNVSHWDPVFVRCVARSCPRSSFPIGLQAVENLQFLADRAQVPAVRTGAHVLALERWSVLGRRAFSILSGGCHDDFSDDPSEWEDQKWKAYFRRFPQELFSLTILSAIMELASVEPDNFTEREQWVYKHLLPDREWHCEHVSWYEYDDLPGDEDDDEPKPWEQ